MTNFDIYFEIMFVDDIQSTKLYSRESHDLGLEYSNQLEFGINGLECIKLRLTHWNEIIDQTPAYSAGFNGLSVFHRYLDLSELELLQDKKSRNFLLLTKLHEAMKVLIEKFDWDKEPFEKAYTATYKKIENDEDLPSFYQYLEGNYN